MSSIPCRKPARTPRPGSLSAYLHYTLELSADELVTCPVATLHEGRRQKRLPEPDPTEPTEAEDVYEVLEAIQEQPRRTGQECCTLGKFVMSVHMKDLKFV